MLPRGGVRQNLCRLYFQRVISKNSNICTYLHGHFRLSELQLQQEMALFDAIRLFCASNRHRKHVTPHQKKKTKNKNTKQLFQRCIWSDKITNDFYFNNFTKRSERAYNFWSHVPLLPPSPDYYRTKREWKWQLRKRQSVINLCRKPSWNYLTGEIQGKGADFDLFRLKVSMKWLAGGLHWPLTIHHRAAGEKQNGFPFRFDFRKGNSLDEPGRCTEKHKNGNKVWCNSI